MGTVSSALWRSTDISAADKIVNYVLSFPSIWPLGQIPKKADALKKSEEMVARINVSGFAREMEQKPGWLTTNVEASRADGSKLRILLCYHKSHSAAGDSSGTPLPLVIWLHGGGYTMGTEQDSIGAQIWNSLSQQHGAHAVYASVSYRYAPEHPAPAAADDCELAARFLLTNSELAQTHGYDCSRVHVWGQSAGAGLSLVLAASLCRAGDAGKVASVLSDAPMCHPPCDTESYTRNTNVAWLAPAAWLRWAWKAYLGVKTSEELNAALLDPKVCPHTAHGGLDGIKDVPVVITTCRGDVLHDEGVRAAEAWRSAGAAVKHVDLRASHCMGPIFDKPQWALVRAKLAELLLSKE